MANKNVISFIEQYGPIAQQVSKEIGVDANIILSQWAKETGWGQRIVPNTNNLGNIKTKVGYGVEAIDNKTKTKDNYEAFEDPEAFGMHYADLIKRLYPDAVNTGIDANAFVKGINKGTIGSYFQEKPDEYRESLINTLLTIPEDMQLPASEGASDDGKNDLVSAPNVPPPPTERKPDTSNASPSDRLLFGGLGAGLGVVGSGAKGFLDNRETNLTNRAYTQELARLRAQKEMGTLPPAAPAAPAAPVTSSILTPSQVAPKQPVPMGVADAGRISSGQTGSNPYNYAKSLGMTDIEAGRALDMTKEAGGAHDLATQRRVALNALQGSGFAENPNFGGLMTQQPSVGGGPRQSFTFQPEGRLTALPPSQPVSMAPKAMPPLSGLDKVNQVFERMMQLTNPLGSAFNTVARRALPPIAAASGGLDLAELAHELQKPEIDRDMAKIITKGGALGSAGIALKNPRYGVPAALGFTGADMIRERYFGPNKSVMDPLTTQPPPIPRVQPQDIMQDAMQQQRNQQMLGLGM
jgi:hypothetical protein